MTDSRLDRQLAFVRELDRLKAVLRRTRLMDGSRMENSAEHSWHLASMALLLHEHAAPGLDLLRTLRMLLVHDVVEIEAGDTFCYDPAALEGKDERERLAAERIFALLPGDQARELRDAWDEFEAGSSVEARFAVALDRLQPLLLNLANQGGTWVEHGVGVPEVRARMEPIRGGAPGLWPLVERLLRDAVELGYLTSARN
jgi:putative hydrolases of HD superfamily